MHYLRRSCFASLALIVAAVAGCRSFRSEPVPPSSDAFETAPRELSKVALPQYTIEPPDILVIRTTRYSARQPYYLQPSDVLYIEVPGTLSEDAARAGRPPIQRRYDIGPGGLVNLGYYGSVKLSGLGLDQAEQAIYDRLSTTLSADALQRGIVVELQEIAGNPPLADQFLVGPDGTVTLGPYGIVSVVGMTIPQAKAAIESQLAKFLDSPEVSVDVAGFNSKVYYVVTQGAGLGDTVARLPVTGNETVLDALSYSGFTDLSSTRIWVARPGRNNCGQVQVLPVDWAAISQCASYETNYQLMPGDRLFISENKLVALDTKMAQVFAPFERIFGFSLLGVNTVTRFSGRVLSGGGLRGAGGGGGGGFGV